MPRKIIYSALFTFALLWTVSAQAAPLQCIFQKSAVVEKNTIQLGDIVHFSENNETTRALASIIVCNAPMPGERILLRSVKVRNSMLRNHPIPRGTEWRGSGTVSVLRKGQKVTSEQILSYINRYIKKNSDSLAPAKIRFLPQETPAVFALPTGEIHCEVIPSRPGILKSSRFSLIFRIAGKTVKNISVRGKVEAIAPVAIVKRNMKRGEEITPADVTFTNLDISRIADAITDQKTLLGKRLRFSLHAGQPLRATILEEIPIIQKGDPVKIIIRSKTMLLTATGFALTNGVKNQIIRVRNSNSNKILQAQVTGPGEVEIYI